MIQREHARLRLNAISRPAAASVFVDEFANTKRPSNSVAMAMTTQNACSWIWTLLAITFLSSLSGCHVWRETGRVFDLARRTTHVEPHYFEYVRSDKVAQREARLLAEQAWSESPDQGSSSPDFKNGFLEGFADYLYRGGSGEPPVVPPRGYWNLRFLNQFGKTSVNDWYAGFRAGASDCKIRGLREMWLVPTSLIADVEPPSAPLSDTLEDETWNEETYRRRSEERERARNQLEKLRELEEPPVPGYSEDELDDFLRNTRNAGDDGLDRTGDDEAAEDPDPLEADDDGDRDAFGIEPRGNDSDDVTDSVFEDDLGLPDETTPQGDQDGDFDVSPDASDDDGDLFRLDDLQSRLSTPDGAVSIRFNDSPKRNRRDSQVRPASGTVSTKSNRSSTKKKSTANRLRASSAEIRSENSRASKSRRAEKTAASKATSRERLSGGSRTDLQRERDLDRLFKELKARRTANTRNTSTRASSTRTTSGKSMSTRSGQRRLSLPPLPLEVQERPAIDVMQLELDETVSNAAGTRTEIETADLLFDEPVKGVGTPQAPSGFYGVNDVTPAYADWDPMEGVESGGFEDLDRARSAHVMSDRDLEETTRWTAEMSRATELPLRVADLRTQMNPKQPALKSIERPEYAAGESNKSQDNELKKHLRLAMKSRDTANARSRAQQAAGGGRVIVRDLNRAGEEDLPVVVNRDVLPPSAAPSSNVIQFRIRD